MICSSGIGFDPHHNRQRLTFGFHGIWQGVAVLYDKQTRSLWMHLTGECIDGRLDGTELKLVSGRHVLWREWKRDHPDTTVMNEDPVFRDRYFDEVSARRGLDYFPPGFEPTIEHVDERLPPSALCYGIEIDSAARAYPYSALMEIPNGIVNDVVGETPVVVFFDHQTRSAGAHGRKLGDETLVFDRAEDGLLLAAESRSRFDLDGRCTSGPLEGEQLPAVVGVQAEWYGWFATYPETTLFELK